MCLVVSIPQLKPRGWHNPSKHARSDSEAFWLCPVMAVMASMQPESNHMLDPSSCIRFQFPSSKEKPGSYCTQNQPRSNLDGLFRFWPNASGSEASQRPRIIGPTSGRTQPAHYEVPTFKLSCMLTQTAWIALCKTSPHPIWFWLTVPGFGQTDPVCKPVCKNHWAHLWLILPSRPGSEANQIQHDYWSQLHVQPFPHTSSYYCMWHVYTSAVLTGTQTDTAVVTWCSISFKISVSLHCWLKKRDFPDLKIHANK